MEFSEIVFIIADILKDFDSERPVHKEFKPGIGPFGEPQIVSAISNRLIGRGTPARTKRIPDLLVGEEWAIEFKIVRPYGDNGREAENWSVNLLHPYPGNTSLIGDAIKLRDQIRGLRKGLIILGYEHNPAMISLDPLIASFELIVKEVIGIQLGRPVEQRRDGLVHPVHQVLRCIGWECFE